MFTVMSGKSSRNSYNAGDKCFTPKSVAKEMRKSPEGADYIDVTKASDSPASFKTLHAGS